MLLHTVIFEFWLVFSCCWWRIKCWNYEVEHNFFCLSVCIHGINQTATLWYWRLQIMEWTVFTQIFISNFPFSILSHILWMQQHLQDQDAPTLHWFRFLVEIVCTFQPLPYENNCTHSFLGSQKLTNSPVVFLD